MRSSSTAEFHQTRMCPRDETLLRYCEGRLTKARRRAVVAHLAACDFCGAAAEMLTRHPRPRWHALPAEPVPPPVALRRLAEDLLAAPSRALAFFVESTLDRERLTLTDA